jgi:hypothetical protein
MIKGEYNMCVNNQNNVSNTYGYQPCVELGGYQPTVSKITEGYQPTSSKGETSTPPSTGSPVVKPKNNN